MDPLNEKEVHVQEYLRKHKIIEIFDVSSYQGYHY